MFREMRRRKQVLEEDEVIAFGKIRIMEDETEMRKAIMALAAEYHPTDSPQGCEDAINREWKSLCVIEFEIEHMIGKEVIELVRARQV